MLSLGDFRLRASWAQGFKSPTPKEQHYRYVRDMGGVRLFMGNTDLKPQTSNYFSLNAEYRTSRLSVSATGYYNKVDQMINLVTIPTSEAPGDLILRYDPAFVRQYRNLEDAYTAGVDVNVRWNVGKGVDVGGGYSYLKARGSVYDEQTEQLRRLTIDGTAHHKGNLFATWNYMFKGEKREERGEKIALGLYGRASSTRHYENYGNGKAYHLWRLTGSYEFTIHNSQYKVSRGTLFRVEAGVDNILNYVDRTPHLRHLGTTTPGTTVFAALVVRFNQGTKVKQQSNYSTIKQKQNEED
jgi:outer membrane receptor for ferrienterochelin and colicins